MLDAVMVAPGVTVTGFSMINGVDDIIALCVAVRDLADGVGVTLSHPAAMMVILTSMVIRMCAVLVLILNLQSVFKMYTAFNPN